MARTGESGPYRRSGEGYGHEWKRATEPGRRSGNTGRDRGHDFRAEPGFPAAVPGESRSERIGFYNAMNRLFTAWMASSLLLAGSVAAKKKTASSPAPQSALDRY